MLIIAIAIMGFLLVFIVPKFEAIFADMLGGKPLPALTQFVIAASNAVKNNIFIIIGVVFALVVLLKIVGKTAKGAMILDTIKLKAPPLRRPDPQKRDLAFQPHAGHAGDERCRRSCRH